MSSNLAGRTIQEGEVCIHPAYGWAWNTLKIKSVDDENDVINLAGNVSYGLMVGDRYFVQNLLAELDAPGEWYLDRAAGKLYFWPPADPKSGEVTAPVAGLAGDHEGRRLHHLARRYPRAVRGHGRAIVRLRDLPHRRLRHPQHRRLGCGHRRRTPQRRPRQRHLPHRRRRYQPGRRDRKTLQRGDNYATNNYIHHIAAFQRTYNTGVNLSGVGNLCSHNLIHDCYHQAILMGGNDQTVEYNSVHHTNLGSEDTGCLYMSSRDWTQRGNTIRYNLFHHPGGFGKSNSWQPVKNGQVEYHYPRVHLGHLPGCTRERLPGLRQHPLRHPDHGPVQP